jgi:hypothetical protein
MICEMIIKAIRFRSKSNVKRLVEHLRNGKENDAVVFLAGTPADIADMHVDAKAKQSTYAIRHWIIAPHEAANRSQMWQVLEMIGQEFGFDPNQAVIVEHKKKRTTIEAAETHWHVLVSEVDPISGKILKCSFDRVLHELVARWSEFKFGHRFVLGKHTKPVIAGLRKRGAVEAAQKLETEFAGTEPPAGEGFTQSQHQEKKRAGVDLPALRQVVKAAVAAATTRADLENLLKAESLTVVAGQKEGTWIVNDPNGNLIGSLSRLGGKRKSEIDDLMRTIRNEPANEQSDYRASNPERGPSNTSAPRQLNQFRDAGPGNADPDAKQDSGVPRTATDPARMPESTAVRVSPPHLKANGWLRGLDEHQGRLSELLGRANTLAMKPAERVMAAIWHLEEQAQFDFHRVVPGFKFSEKVVNLRADLKNLEMNLSKIRDQHFDAELRFRKAPRVRWWHYLFGIAFIVERRFRMLEKDAQEAADDLVACERGLQTLNSKVLREEIAEKDRHAGKIKQIAERKRVAEATLEMVEAAYGILRQQPALAFGGVEFVLSRARAVLQKEKEVALKAAIAENDGVSLGPTI